MEKSEILDFVKRMEPRDHVILFYYRREDKHSVLFTYLKAGLDQGEAAAYVAGEEAPWLIRDAMKEFGIDVDKLEASGALRVIDYTDWYIIGGKFDLAKTMERWKELYDYSTSKGFKGLRITGEMACFFQHGMVKELLEYERALHRVLEMPMMAICAYDSSLDREGVGQLYLDLIKAHTTVIFTGPGEIGLVKSH